jgi:acyl-CoA thioester hydrolase
MTSDITYFRVAYSDTDQMGFMHHSNYLRHYESARWELFRKLGIPYSELEKDDLILPVVSASLKYLKPAFYDNKIKITTKLASFKGPRIVFEYQMIDENQEILNEARIIVGCVRKSTGKACFPPEKLTKALINPNQ